MPDKGRGEGPWLSLEDERLLKLLAEDRTTQEIAEELGASPSTVRRRVESIVNKMGLPARMGLPPRSMPSLLVGFPAHALLSHSPRGPGQMECGTIRP
jgi:DNA-binding CsgD family transcriptional regulator